MSHKALKYIVDTRSPREITILIKSETLFLSLHFICCTTYDKNSVSIYMHLHFISPVATSANMTSLHPEHENTPVTRN